MKSEQLARSMNWKRVAPFIAIFLLVLLLKPLSQWISPVPPQLVFDPYLTEERLDVLFNDFSADISASAPNTWVFTHLVNGVRQLYVSQLLKLQQEIVEKREQQEVHLNSRQEQHLAELMSQYEHQLMETHGQRLSNLTEEHEQRISKLMKQHESQSTERIEQQRSEWMKEHERQLVELMEGHRQRLFGLAEAHEQRLSKLMKQYGSQSTERIERQLSEWMKEHERQFLEAAAARCAADSGKGAPKVKPMPANTDTLYVGAALNPRRDMVGWSRQGGRTWTDRLDFQVFRFAEVDTIKITVGENSGGKPRRIYVVENKGALPVGWQERLHFYAFKTERPNTEMISVGRARDLDSERCIFVRGNHADKLPGWNEKFVFWVPV